MAAQSPISCPPGRSATANWNHSPGVSGWLASIPLIDSSAAATGNGVSQLWYLATSGAAFQGGIPFKSNFDWNLLNYTPLPVFAAFALFGGWYLLSGRKWFKGPVRQGDEAELERIEAGYESPGSPATSPAGQA